MENSKLENKKINNTNEDILRQLQDTQELLHKTELRLCEMEIEKIRFCRKYMYYKREASYWKDQTRQVKEQIEVLVNSRFWKLRSVLLAPINCFRKLSEKKASFCESEKKEAFEAMNLTELPDDSGWEHEFLRVPRIAIQVHVFYPDLFKDICDGLANVPYKYDLYITTDEKYKATYILDYLNKNNTAVNYYLDIVENKGRDVIPFLKQIQSVFFNYDYICHLHTKRTLHSNIGKLWRNYLYENLVGNTHQIKRILYEFESNPKMGLIFPDVPKYLKKSLGWANNKQNVDKLMELMKLDKSILPEEIIFPAGTMFWARMDAIKDLFLIDIDDLNVPDERDQIDGTVMHAIERVFPYLAQANGYNYLMYKSISNIELSDD